MMRTPAISTKQNARVLWQPTEQQISDSNLYDFATMVAARRNNQQGWSGDYHELWQWSIDDSPAFWDALWDWQGIIGDKGNRKIANESAMPGARFFPDGRLCFAENILADADNRPAISAYGEDGRHTSLTRRELKDRVMALAGWMRNQGVDPGDRVAAYVPNIAEAIIIMLATSTLGGVFSSCSPDFGIGGAHDRFSQIEPKLLFACDGYHYAGKALDRRDVVAKLAAGLPSLSAIVIIPYLDATPDLSGLAGAVLFDQALTAPPVENFIRVGFNDPLYILFSSGTTGAPKCIVHGVGGTTLQHAKELRLQSDVKQGDALFFFTTCGWMMWNWLIAGLATGSTIMLYDGSPFAPDPLVLWRFAREHAMTGFGLSAKYVDALNKQAVRPKSLGDYPALRAIASTGSTLIHESFDYLYEHVKTDLPVASVSAVWTGGGSWCL